jgi:hypothetical protein
MVKSYMSTTQTIGNRDWIRAVSIALIICSGLWLASAFVYYVTSSFKSDWSTTPLLWMLTVMLTPAICFSGVLILSDARKRSQSSRLEWCALAVAILPVTFGTLLAVWAVKGLFAMSGV